MRSRLKTTGGGFLLLVLFFAFVSQVHAQDLESNMIKYGRVMQLIQNYYVDTTNINKLTEDAISEVLSELDPHSVYISKEEVEEMNEPLEGSFEGIGISFNILRDTLLVVTTIPGGPSEKVGLMPGDRILYVDNKLIAGTGLKNSDVMTMLRGEKGTRVDLRVLRTNEPGLLDFSIIRDKIPINSLDASYMLDDKTGYVKLNRFSATTTDEFSEAIKGLKKDPGFKNLILDLRGNGGGYLKAAIGLADQFLGAYQLVVYTQGIHESRKDYRASSLGQFEDGRLVVLIDEGSASASEIVSGAIQDWDRGLIIGRRSFGKGLVQQPFPLNDGSVIRLTTAHYYTPSGRCIQKPYDKGIEAYQNDYLNRLENGELFSKDSIHQDKDQVYQTLKNKRTVYGGGGIMPDIFVPLDTSSYYQYYNLLNRKNILYTKTLDYLVANREGLASKYKSFEAFRDNFEVNDDLVNGMIDEAEKEGIKRDEKGIDFARPLIKKLVKALLARDLFDPGCYYRIMNQDENIIKRALEVIENPDEYVKLLVAK